MRKARKNWKIVGFSTIIKGNTSLKNVIKLRGEKTCADFFEEVTSMQCSQG